MTQEDRRRRHDRHQREAGLHRTTVWVPVADVEKLRSYARELCQKHLDKTRRRATLDLPV